MTLDIALPESFIKHEFNINKTKLFPKCCMSFNPECLRSEFIKGNGIYKKKKKWRQ